MARACLHFADIGNPCREHKISSEWGKLVVTEFYEQGDVMRDLGLEISPGCDRFENSGDQNTSAKPKFDFNTMCFEPLLNLIIPFVPQLKTEALIIYNANNKLRSDKALKT
ncbi:high affinity cAMP-specific 3',5'-cyclic phosphodiesterase 7A [Reticulomyxa filosa]|uniref:High affinity cAMP-specific 3',5'-cyclic phosphodiesterase 7A n=1 Tax=Reticulomyxa filosa TaxID=46433 RepID=X6P089_RETFI|nr:high affinity cAMP-specific 3',5'-cyclic phosphodiesterase 7A [Reticulomyxa filosa]|eukprot:ETO31489.1 high affinity cAMP-specific 3',5'-cyclic phosphodiesterase 7A [Reticulomyxa filosa]